MDKDLQLVLFTSSDGDVVLDVNFAPAKQEVWLTKEQMSLLFGRDRSVISRHISNIYSEKEVDASSTCANFAQVRPEGERLVEREVEHYNLDVIISVGYRVKSQRGIEFRRWATDVLRRYILDGKAENEQRLRQLSQIMLCCYIS